MGRLSTRRGKLDAFGKLVLPEEAEERILAPAVRGVLIEWLEELWAEAELLELGVRPRKRAIFNGPPGVGKTTLAHHLAARLGLPMLAVRPERLASPYIGETSIALGELFDLAEAGVSMGSQTVPLLLFLDEFDALSRQRRPGVSGGDDERNAEVNVLLGRLEAFGGFVIAATNFGETVDQAIWRRFDLQLDLELPGPTERALILRRYLVPFGLPAAALRVLAESLEGASPDLIRKFCENLKRQLVIGPKLKRDMSREAVVDRVLAGCKPHPSLGKPRLWSLGARDAGLQAIPWPLPRASDLPAEAAPAAAEPAESATVVQFGRRP